MQIAFWSPVHGQTATTTNAAAIACMMALEYKQKILVTHNHYEKSTLESILMDQRTYLNETGDFSGIDALSRFLKFSSAFAESIENFTYCLLKNRLDLLAGTNHPHKSIYIKESIEVFERILHSAKECYDIVIVDVSAGYNEVSKSILGQSDLIVVNLNQNGFILDNFFTKEYAQLKQKCYFLLSFYDASSRYNLKNIKRRYKVNNIGVVPYSRAFSDSCNEGRLIDYLYRNFNADVNDESFELVSALKENVRNIFELLGEDAEAANY